MLRRHIALLACLIPVLLWAQLSSAENFIASYPTGRLTPTISVLSTNATQVGLYEKFEAVLKLQNATYTNPFNPDLIDVRATFHSPAGTTWEIFAFYDDYQSRNQWKVRFSPNELGTWRYSLQATDKNGTGSSAEYTFQAVASAHNGWLKTSTVNPHYFMHDDGTPFYGVSVSYPWGVNNSATGLAGLEAAGANMFYYWNITYGGEGNLIESQASGLAAYDQPKCGRIDQILEWSEARGLKMMLSIWPHDVLSETVWATLWDINPYNELCDVREFYGDEEAWIFQEYQYRYLIARWGHSRSLAIWESVCEINGTDGWAYGNQTDGLNWVRKVHEFFKANDPYGRPTTASQSGGRYWTEGYGIVDLPNVHLYETSWSPHYSGDPLRSSLWIYGDISQTFWKDYDKPCIMGEAGYTDNYGGFAANSNEYLQLYHNALWVSWANGLAATPQWWDYGTKSIFTPALMNQILAFSKVAPSLDYAHTFLSHASISVAGCDAYAMKGDTVAFGWIRDIEAYDVSNRLFILSGLNTALYSIEWINPWTGNLIQLNSRQSLNDQLIDQIPQFDRNLTDIAFIVQPSRSGSSAQRMELVAYPAELYNDPSFTSNIICYIVDAQGKISTQDNYSVTFTLEGPGLLQSQNPVLSDHGMASIIYQADENAGTALITATASALTGSSTTIVIHKFLHIDDFEEYTADAELQDVWQQRFGTTMNRYCESTVVGSGTHSMRLEYKVGDGSTTYAGVYRSLIGDWSKADFLTFWLKPDASGRTLQIRLYENDQRYWYYNYALSGSDSLTLTIPLRDFSPNSSAANLNSALLNRIAVYVNRHPGASGSGIIYLDDLKFLPDQTHVASAKDRKMPGGYTLYPNYPNPFNHDTVIQYEVPDQSNVRLAVYNIQGQVVDVLVDAKQQAGIYKVQWNAGDVVSGIYFYRLHTPDRDIVQKCVLVK